MKLHSPVFKMRQVNGRANTSMVMSCTCQWQVTVNSEEEAATRFAMHVVDVTGDPFPAPLKKPL